MIIVIFTMMHKNKIKQEPQTNELIAWLVRGKSAGNHSLEIQRDEDR